MSKMLLEVIPDLNATNDPNAWMVYTDQPAGGYVTLFNGTKAECDEYVATSRAEIMKLRASWRRQWHEVDL